MGRAAQVHRPVAAQNQPPQFAAAADKNTQQSWHMILEAVRQDRGNQEQARLQTQANAILRQIAANTAGGAGLRGLADDTDSVAVPSGGE